MYNLHEAYLDVYESRKGMPGELRPTFMPKSREQNIGKFDDWRHETPETWEGKTANEKAAARLKSRANAAVQTQRRQDREVGLREEELNFYDVILDYLLDEGYADTEHAAQEIISVMSEEWIDNILNESDSVELAQLRKKMNAALQSGNKAEVASIASRLSEIQAGTKAKIGAALNRDNPKPDAKSSGPQKPKDVVSGLSSPTLRTSLANQATQMINRIPDNPNRPARMSTHVTRSGEVRPNISQDTSSGIDTSRHTDDRNQRRRPARQRTQQRGLTAPDPNRPITTRNQTD